MRFELILLTLCLISLTHAKENEPKTNIDKFYKSNIERQAEETDSQQVQTFVKPAQGNDEEEEPVTTSTIPSYLSRGFGNRRINPKGVVVDDPIVKSESRRQEEEVRHHSSSDLHEPHVHESEPEEPAIVVTEIITRHNEYTTEAPVTSRAPSQYPNWAGYSNVQYHPLRPNHRSSGQSMKKSSQVRKVSSTSSSSSSYEPTNKEEHEAQPSIPEPTNPESSIKVKEGQAAARQYFYNSRWVPKSYAHSAQQMQKKNEYGNSDFGQETQQLDKVAERDNEMLLVFAHSIEIPLVVASPQAARRSNSVYPSTSEAPATAPRILFITEPRSTQMQAPKPQQQPQQQQQQARRIDVQPKSPLLSQRWGYSPLVQASPQMRMIPLRYPVMRRSSFAYPYADVTTVAASEPSLVTTGPLPPRSYHPHHHYPNYISGRQPNDFMSENSRNNRRLVIPMPSEKLVTILPLS